MPKIKEDKLSDEDKKFAEYFKKTFGVEVKTFKFKNTKNAGAIKSQILEVYRYSLTLMKTKNDFKINCFGTTYNYWYQPKIDNYKIIRVSKMSKRDRRIWLG